LSTNSVMSTSVVNGEIRLSYAPVTGSSSIVIAGATTGAATIGFLDGTFSGFTDAQKDTSKSVVGFSAYRSSVAATAVVFSVGDGLDTVDLNLIPDYVVRRQKTFKLAWHGMLLLLLIFLVPLGLNYLYMEKVTAEKEALQQISNLDKSKLLVFGGCSSASRDAGVTMQMVGEKLGIKDLFLGVDKLEIQDSGALRISERAEGGNYLVSECSAPPAVLAWATGSLPEPPNNPQVGMANMRKIMPALQQAQPVSIGSGNAEFKSVTIPQQKRDTKIIKDMPAEEIAKELVEWIKS